MGARENLGQQFYHITDNPNFELDPTFKPENNTTLGGNMPAGIFLSQHPESWVNGHNYIRPYVAEINAPHDLGEKEGVFNGYHGETYVPAQHMNSLHLNRVIPLDAHARERYNDFGWIEEHHGTTFDTDTPIPRRSMFGGNQGGVAKDYHYDGPDVREMSTEEHERHSQRAQALWHDRTGE